MSRPVFLPDGTVYANVPDSVSDEEVLQKHLRSKQEDVRIAPFTGNKPQVVIADDIAKQEEKEEEPVPEVAAPVEKEEPPKRPVTTDIVRGLTQYGKFVPKVVTDIFGVPKGFKSQEQFIDQTVSQFAQTVSSIIPGVELEDIVTEKGKVKERGILGITAEAVPYLIGGSAVAGSKLVSNLPTFTKAATTAGGIGALNQLFYTGTQEDTIFRSIEDADLFEAETAARDFVEFMSIDKDDTVLEERVKLAVDNAVAGTVGLGLLKGVEGAVKQAAKFKKPLEELTNLEQVEAIVAALKETRS